MKLSLPFSNCFSISTNTKIVNENGDGSPAPKDFWIFTYKELKAACNGFSNKIGEGGFGCVYKGRLDDGTPVAVKVLSVEVESMRGEREFLSELASLSTVKHENLVNLRGCCVNGAQRFLIYDHMENNSLSHTFLGAEQNRIKFSWKRRRQVVIGIARGIAYLHGEVRPHIIHRDIKARNILLDQNFTPKISDFGLSKLFRENTSHISTRVAGTIGYLAPEYAFSGHLTRKSDVYSFGVLLLEIVSGNPVVVFDWECGEQHLAEKAWETYKAGKLGGLVDPMLNGDYPEREAVRFLKVGLLCVQETSKLRPHMSVAVKMLTGVVDIANKEISRPGLVADLTEVKIGGSAVPAQHMRQRSHRVLAQSAPEAAIPD